MKNKNQDKSKPTAGIFFLVLMALLALAARPALAWNTNQIAAVVVGQPDMTGSTCNNGGIGANTLCNFSHAFSDGTRLYVADWQNNRVLIYNSIPTSNNAAADVVIGQPDMTSNADNNGGIGANTLYRPSYVYSDGMQLFIADTANHRVLIYNTIPTANNASADVVVGQPDMTSNAANNGGRDAGTFYGPTAVHVEGSQMFVADSANNRVLIYNAIPTTDNANADYVVGQPDMTSGASNNGGRGANTLFYPYGVNSDGTKLYITDTGNSRVLIYNTIPTASNTGADVVVGQPDMTSYVYGAAGMADPSYSYSDGSKLFVGDSSNSRVLIYDSVPTTNGAAADNVIGQTDFVSISDNKGNGVASADTLRYPYSAWVVGQTMIIADTGNNRVLIYDYPPVVVDSQTGDNTTYSTDPGAIFDVDFVSFNSSKLNNVQYTVYSAAAMGGVQLKAWTDIATGINANQYTTNWGVDWASLQTGTNYVSVRAYDTTGNVGAVSQDVFYIKKGVAPAGGLCGDIDEDGRIRSKDLVLLKQHIAGTITTPLTPSQLAKGDLAIRATGNTDGSFDATDTALLADTVTGKYTTAQLKCPANP